MANGGGGSGGAPSGLARGPSLGGAPQQDTQAVNGLWGQTQTAEERRREEKARNEALLQAIGNTGSTDPVVHARVHGYAPGAELVPLGSGLLSANGIAEQQRQQQQHLGSVADDDEAERRRDELGTGCCACACCAALAAFLCCSINQ
jgi:hypothetical protein